MFQSTIYLIYGLVRPILKWLMHTFTRLNELQRICYGTTAGSERTKGVERSLRLSRQAPIKQMIVYIDQQVEDELPTKEMSELVGKLVHTIVISKRVDTRIHPDFKPLLRGCVEAIWGYQRLYHIIERHRCTQYDCSNLDHERKLYRLWELLCPDDPLQARITKQWQDIGFQGDDPKTDFRGMGMLGLDNLLFFAQEYNGAARHVVSHSKHPTYGYTFAIVGINMTSMAYTLVKSGAAKTHFYNSSRKCPSIEGFHKLYCYLMYEFDRYWMESKPTSLMDFSFIHQRFETNILKKLQEPHTHFRINLAVENV